MNASEHIDKQIADLPDWRGEVMAKLRKLIHEVDPEITEEWKWETGVYVHNGLVCAVGVFKDHVKINFFKGVMLPDPKGLFNSGLESKSHRGVDIYEGDRINEVDLKEIIYKAVQKNR